MIVNLYEFLEIGQNASIKAILDAIAKAEEDGKDPKLILASKNLLCDSIRRKNYDESLKKQLALNKKPIESVDADLWALESIEQIKKRVHKQDMQVFAGIGLVVLCFVSFLIFKWNSNADAREFRSMQNNSAFTCAELAKKRVKYPATFDRRAEHLHNEKWVNEAEGKYSLMLPFSANNAFNVPVEHIAVCLVDVNLGVKLMSVL